MVQSFPLKNQKTQKAQQATFSASKNHNTMKVIVRAMTRGLVSYVSEAYGWSASDRQIIKRSKLTEIVTPEDEIMTDKGFNCDDIFLPCHVAVNISAFSKRKNHMSNETVDKDCKIASKRVHIERIMSLGKTYKISTAPMNPVKSSMATHIASVCFWLRNFRECFVSKTA